MVTVSTMAALVVDGLAFGASLALLGVGITLVYGLGEVLNLAIGAFAVIAAILAALLIESGLSLPIAVLGGLAFVGVFGLVVDRTLLSMVYRSDGEERILIGIFTTLGLTVLLEGVMVNYVASQYSLPLGLDPIQLGSTVVTGTSVASIVVAAVVLAVLFLFLNRTFLGKATRTVFQDERGARLVGINPRKIRTLVFVLSVLGTLPLKSLKTVGLVVVTFGAVFVVTPSSLAPVQYRFLGLALLIVGPMLVIMARK